MGYRNALGEEFDTVRTIHMNAGSGSRPATPSLLGYSVGRWEGPTLVVTTTGVSWRHFDQVGVPLGTAATIVERFTPTPDGSRLDYEMTVTDPATFTKGGAEEILDLAPRDRAQSLRMHERVMTGAAPMVRRSVSG